MLTLLAAAAISPAAPHPDLRRIDRLAIDGVPHVRIEGRANVFEFGNQSNASLAALPDGRFALAWQSRRQRGGLPGVYVRLFEADGRPSGGESPTTNSPVEFNQTDPSVELGAFGATTFYASQFRDGSASGVFVGDRQLSVRFKGDQERVATATLPDGRIAAVWSGEVARDSRRVFLRLLDSNGKPISPEIRLTNSSSGNELMPAIAAGPDGLAVAWQRHEGERMDGVFVRRLDLQGKVIGNAVQVANGSSLEPSVAFAGRSIVMAWHEPHEAGFRVAARRLDLGLKPIGPRFLASEQTGSQNGAAVAGRADGRFAIAWNRTTPSGTDVWARVFGSKPGNAFVATRHQAGDQALTAASGSRRMTYDASGLTLAWSGDAGLGDASAAHFTRLVPAHQMAVRDGEVNMTTERLLARQAERERGVDQGEVRVATEVATPHIPPTFDPRMRENPWSVGGDARTASGFLGIVNTGWTPPDPHMATGPNHLLAMTNGAIAWFTKDGTKQFQQLIEGASGFWGSLGATGFVFDPEAFYDTIHNRYWAMAAEGQANGNTRSFVLFAVSDDDDPNGTWYKYRIETTNFAGNLFDSPNIGVDRNVLYVTGDGFGRGANYPVYTFDKASILAGQPPAIQRSTTMSTSTQSAGIPEVQDGDNGAYYLLEHQEGSGRTGVSVIALTDPLGTITFQRFTLTVPAYSNPGPIQQGGTTSTIQSFDSRFWSSKYQNGYLWATHHTDSPIRARWYQIALNGWPFSGNNPTLVQSGVLNFGGRQASFSSIGVDEYHNVAITAARSSTSDFLAMAIASRRSYDALGTLPTEVVVKSATGGYTQGRWGDYSAIDPDPLVAGRFWGHHEWAEGNAWRTWIESHDVSSETAINPGAFNVTRGVLNSGGLADLLISDDSALVVDQRPPFLVSDPNVQVVVSTLAPADNIATFRVKVESRSNGSPSNRVVQRIEAFNFATNSWVNLGERNPSATDAVWTVPASGPSSQYVQPGTREMRVRLGWFDRGTIAPNWGVAIDEVDFLVGQ